MNILQQFLSLSTQSAGIIPILALLFIVVLAVAIERVAFFAKAAPSGAEIDHRLNSLDFHDERSVNEVATRYRSTVYGATLQAVVEARSLNPDEMDRYIDEAIVRTLPQLDRHLWMLDTAVTLGPLIGLLGTIIGITESFNVLGAAGPSAGAVTGGISHALIATGCGLLVAIVGVAANGYFAKRVRLAMLCLDLIKLASVKRTHLVGRSTAGTAGIAGAADTRERQEHVASVRAMSRTMASDASGA
ncbi:outer membrane transport energization protein ExbB [Trinickia symbiotica]|uniref:MotA/TolQ/ExbB proton channel family protein n=1 Tax=Trinickia symbiotica TaxID=863227 RepID=A0A2N7X632_9BURK|nr:MotA/TolQ/ExbB proton channel family protein [Trinickia symbiotica]PMS37219.1 MotA/TolQ/ExbB proton channel family protein [Trinickia symbiotica]PPK42712.1 outer membrane transport energization protein ExbB [Trinickia symbiotica]